MRVRDDVSAVRTEYGTVLLDERAGRYFKLSPTAGVVFDALRGGGSAEDAVAALRRNYAVDEQRARSDVDSLVERLAAMGVLRR